MSETGPAPATKTLFRRRTPGARNVAASYVGAAAEGFVFLLLTPFLARRLGMAGLGLWGLAVAVADWLPLLDFGLREALLKFVAAHQARGDLPAARRTLEAVLFVYCLLGLVAVGLVLLFAWSVIPWFAGTAEEAETLTMVFGIVGVSAAISLPAGALGSLLEGLSRFDLLNLLRIGHQVLRLILVVLALQFQFGLVGVAAAELAARLALHLARLLAIRNIRPELVVFPKPHFEEVDRLFHLGVWNAFRQGAEVAMLRLYEPILAAFSGFASVGAFWAGRRFAAIPAEAIVPMAGVLLPLSSEMEAEGRHVDLRRTLVETTKLGLVIAVPLALLIGIGAPMIQTNWLAGKAPEAEPVMTIFAAVFVGVAASLPAEAVLLGLGWSRFVAFCSLAQAALLLMVGIPLAARYGAPGLAFGALVANLVGQVALQIPAAARACGIPLAEWARRAFAPALKAGVPVGIAMVLLRDRLAVGGLAGLAAWGGGAVFSYIALCWVWGLTVEEKQFITDHASRIFREPSRNGTNAP